jgi:hypothetical protein
MMNEKIDRPLVKMTRTRDDGGYDFYWYKTMMGKQNQINTLLRQQIELLESSNATLRSTVNVVNGHKDMLQREIDNKIFVFRPWKLFKKKKKNVGD